MSKRSEYAPGTFNWVDLMSHDMASAGSFYAELFGWTVEQQDTHGGPPYAMFMKDGEVIAGMGRASDEMKAQGVPPMWNSYVSVADARATAARAEQLGGKLQFPVMDIMNSGAMTFLTDPEGAMIGLWQPNEHIGATLVNEPGAFSWNELLTRDVTQAKGFYGELFGWTFEEIPRSGHGPEMMVIKNGGEMNGTVIKLTEQMGPMPACWMAYFAVEDCDAAIATVERLGGKLVMPPMDIEPGRLAVVADPQGATFYVMKLNQPA